MTSPQNNMNPLTVVLPGIALFIVLGVLMLLLLADTPTVEQEVTAAEVSVETEEVVATEEPAETEAVAEAAPTEESAATEETTTASQSFDPALATAGEVQYMTACVACHGFDARGITGLGKNLIESEFVGGLTQDEFVAFVNTGRDITDPLNTTGVMMPPKGGNPALTDDNIAAIYNYILSLRAQAEGAAADTTEETVSTETEEASSADTGAGGEVGAYDPSLVGAGEVQYMTSCVACHGFDLHGITGLGKNLVQSEFLNGLTQDEFIEFVNTGRDITDPLNTTMVMMPPKGGNPALTDDDIAAIWAYIRSKTEAAGG